MMYQAKTTTKISNSRKKTMAFYDGDVGCAKKVVSAQMVRERMATVTCRLKSVNRRFLCVKKMPALEDPKQTKLVFTPGKLITAVPNLRLGSSQEKYRELLLRMMVDCSLPFNVVGQRAFTEFAVSERDITTFLKLRNRKNYGRGAGLKLVSRRTLRRDLEKLYAKVRLHFATTLLLGEFAWCLQFDMWT